MNVIRNDRLIRSRVRLASGAHVAALASFAGGLFLSYHPENLWFTYATMVVGLVLYSVGQHLLRKWGPRNRYDGWLATALKGLDPRYTLFAFVTPSLPEYIVTGPQGVTALIVRPQSGTIVCRHDQWSRTQGRFGFVGALFSPALKNPTADAGKAVQVIRPFLETHASDLPESPPVQAMVVFVHQGARLRIDGCSVPVTTARELRGHLRKGKAVLSTRQVESVAGVFQAEIPS